MNKSIKKISNNNSDNNIALSLLWDILPEELESLFEIESYEKTPKAYRIRLTEKNIIPEYLPEKYHGKKIINSYTREITIDDFPLRGRKAEIILRNIGKTISKSQESQFLRFFFVVFLKWGRFLVISLKPS